MSLHPARTPQSVIGPVPDDILAQMIQEASETQMHDHCDVPGTYFRLLILPALQELRDLRAQMAAQDDPTDLHSATAAKPLRLAIDNSDPRGGQ